MMTTPQRAPTKQLYGRRKGWKLSLHQSGLVETMLPALALKLQPGGDPKAYFNTVVEDVWLEIGFGGGEHLIGQAGANPSIGLIGAEPFIAGMAKLLSKLDAAKIANVRLYTEHNAEVKEPYQNFFLERYMDSYRLELAEFIKKVNGQPSNSPSFEDGRSALVLANAALESAQTGKTVAVEV